MIQSPELAAQISGLIKSGMKQECSWKVSLVCEKPSCKEEDKTVRWEGKKDGREMVYKDEPEEGFWQRSSAKLLSHLPFKTAL